MPPGPQSPMGIGSPPFFGDLSPTRLSEELQISDQEMIHIRNQKPASIMNATGGFQSGNEQIAVTETASAASDPEASFASSKPSSSTPTSTNRSDRKQPLTEGPSRTFICDLCNRRFRHQEQLERYYRSAHTQEEYFGCSECVKRFSYRDNLARHARIHTGGAIVKNRIEDPNS
ncbi:hypothetical protein J3E69DRAFT_1960 [Trichoderma sp. SZMC 28015]